MTLFTVSITKERNMKKTIIAILVALFCVFSISAQPATDKSDNTPVIGISKLLAHPALDAIEEGIKDQLADDGIDAIFDVQNANGEISTAASIAKLFETENVDIAIGIATPTAQALANVFSDIPVIFSSVTDVPAAGLDGIENVCGVSDAVPLATHFALIERLTGAKRIGMVYTSGEANGVSMMAGMKAICEENGVEFVSASVSNSSEVRMAAASIIDRVDAMYVATDNTVISAIASLSDVCDSASVPLFSADTTSAFESNVLIAGGFDYYASGRLTGKIVKRILEGETPEEIGTVYLTDLEYYINLDVADRLGIEIPADLIENSAYLMRDGVNILE